MTPQFRPTDQGSALTVFGFGMNRAVFRAVFRNQHGTEQVWTALQLGTNPSAKICYLVRRADDLGHGPVRLASVPRRKEEKRGPQQFSGRPGEAAKRGPRHLAALYFATGDKRNLFWSFPHHKGLRNRIPMTSSCQAGHVRAGRKRGTEPFALPPCSESRVKSTEPRHLLNGPMRLL